MRLQKQAWYDQGCLPGVGLVDVDDIAQPQRRNTGVEQFLLWLGKQRNKPMNDFKNDWWKREINFLQFLNFHVL